MEILLKYLSVLSFFTNLLYLLASPCVYLLTIQENCLQIREQTEHKNNLLIVCLKFQSIIEICFRTGQTIVCLCIHSKVMP